jgi:hypothetical protein
MQKQPILVPRPVWVAGWLWRQHKQQRTKQAIFDLLIKQATAGSLVSKINQKKK